MGGFAGLKGLVTRGERFRPIDRVARVFLESFFRFLVFRKIRKKREFKARSLAIEAKNRR